MIEGGGSSCLVVCLHGDLLKDEICFTGKAPQWIKALSRLLRYSILSALTANSVLCQPVMVLQCVWGRCKFWRCRCDFKNLFGSDG